MSSYRDEEFFQSIAEEADLNDSATMPSRLKSKIYTALMRLEAADGPLMSLAANKSCGQSLCVFEELVQVAPVGERAKTQNICLVCHARVLAERLDKAPIYWPGCPYVAFQKP